MTTTATDVNAVLRAFEDARKRALELRIDAQRARAKHTGAVRINGGMQEERCDARPCCCCCRVRRDRGRSRGCNGRGCVAGAGSGAPAFTPAPRGRSVTTASQKDADAATR